MGTLAAAASASGVWQVFVIVLGKARRARRLAAFDLSLAAVAFLALSASLECSAAGIKQQPLINPVEAGMAEYPWRIYEYRMQLFVIDVAKRIDAANLQSQPNTVLASHIHTALRSDVTYARGGRFDHIKATATEPKMTVDFSVIVFDSGLSIPDGSRPWIVPGQYPAAASRSYILGSDGLFPWQLPPHSCTSNQEFVPAVKRPVRAKGMPCEEGQAVAVPKLKTELPGTKACLIFIQQPHESPQVLNLRKLALAESLPVAIFNCAHPKEVKLLPIDLTTLASCFAAIMPAHGLAIAPAKVFDPENKVSNFHDVELGFISLTGNVMMQRFDVWVRHPESFILKSLAFWVIAMPSWLPPGESSLASAPGESSEANAPI